MAADAYPVQILHRAGDGDGGGGGSQWHNLGAAHAAARILRPQGLSLVLYAGAAAADQPQQGRIVFAYPVLPGDAFERLDGETLAWTDPSSGDEFALCFIDEAACAAVHGALAQSATATTAATQGAVDGVAEKLAGLRVAREEGAPAGGGGGGDDVAARLARLCIGR